MIDRLPRELLTSNIAYNGEIKTLGEIQRWLKQLRSKE